MIKEVCGHFKVVLNPAIFQPNLYFKISKMTKGFNHNYLINSLKTLQTELIFKDICAFGPHIAILQNPQGAGDI